MSDDQRAIYLEGAHDSEPGRVCPSCERWFPEHEFTQDWRLAMPDECEGFCEGCVDEFFADDTCAHVTADGSMEYC